MQTLTTRDALSRKLAELTEPVADLEEGLLASAVYDGDLRLAVLKFYDPKAGRFYLWRDNTGHKPYCYTKLPNEELTEIRSRKDVIDIVDEEKTDLLADERVTVRKIITTDPLAIGGGNDSIRDKITAWEADIKYYENYAYDKGLRMGAYYKVSSGKVLPIKHEVPERVAHSLEEILKKNPPEFVPYIMDWAELLGQPLCEFKRVALDIEVANEAGRLPDPEDPRQPVIAVSFCSEQEKLVYIMRDGKPVSGLHDAPFAAVLFDSEVELLRAVMAKMLEYPVVVTFNGDDFDLRYLKHRAELKGIAEEENPIQLERIAASIKHGIHVDLYQLFRNRSIQVYAFSNKYSEHTLNGISEALLGKSKLEFEGEIGDLPIDQLARYCFNDSLLTYELTTTTSSAVMKLLVVLARIGKMPMNDVARLGVSNWIRSMLFFEHRKIGALIPRSDELLEKGGASSQAIIKGKKYKGGLVIEPKPGVYFGVSVLDFASLYPSLIKVHNLSYETVNCPHEECRRNVVPETTHWVCTRRKGVTSLVTGSLRDLRVSHYKPLAKDPSLSKDERELNNVVTQGLKVVLNACFTGDTDLITPHGIKNIKDFRVGDLVVNVNPETLRTEIDRVVDVQRFPYKGDLYHFKDRRFVDLIVTPNHRFLVKDKRVGSTGATFMTAEEILRRSNIAVPKLKGGIEGGDVPRMVSLLQTAKKLGAIANIYPGEGRRLSSWFFRLPQLQRRKIRDYGEVDKNRSKLKDSLRSHYRVPAAYLTEEDIDVFERTGGFVLIGEAGASKIPARFDPVSLASLCGWFVSEGNLTMKAPKLYTNGNRRGRSSGILITQSYGAGNSMGVPFRAEIKRTLEQMGLRGITDSNDSEYYKVSNSIIHEWMRENCYVAGSARPDSFTKRIPRFVFHSNETMDSFLSSCYKGDGSRRGSLYSTVSVQLAEDMAVLLSLLGFKTKVKYTRRERIFRITFGNTSSKLTFSGQSVHKHIEKVGYEGDVYCVTTERNRTVIAGRNGRFVHVGQSYGVMGFETFAFYCLPVAEATAAFGRDAITKTIQKASGLGINVIYGDSVTGERCVTVLDPDRFLKVIPIERFFNGFPHVTRADDKDEAHPQGWKALSINPATGRVEFKPLLAVVRHRSTKRIFRVREKWGVTRVTEDHSLLARTATGLTFAGPLELQDKHLVRIEQIPSLRDIESIDTFEVLRRLRYPTEYKGRTKVMKACCDDDWVWFGWTNRKKRIRLKRHIRTGTPEFSAIVELLGAYVPEGSSSTPDTTQSGLGASISCSDVNWLTRLRECYYRLFDGTKAGLIRSDHGERRLLYQTSSGPVATIYEDKTYKLQMMNGISAAFFKAFAGQGDEAKMIPEFIFHSPTEYKCLFLENLIKGDGSRVFGKRYSEEYALKNFKYETKSLQLISGLSFLLTLLGTKHTINYRPPKQTYIIQTCSNHNKRQSLPQVTEESYDGYVYDLTVADYHTFVDSCGGIVLKNTDSLFLQNPSKEQISTVTHWADTDLGVELDLDKTYRYVAFSSRKKNYFGVLPDGTPDIKGLTGKKSTTPEFLKKTFYQGLEILSNVQSPEDFARARERIRELLTTTMGRLKNKQIPVSELAFNTMMGKPTANYGDTTPQHVRAAQLLEKNGREIKAGDIIAYVKTKSPPFVKPVELAKVDDVDVEKYLEYARSMFDQMLDAMDFSFDEIMGATTLDFFWSS